MKNLKKNKYIFYVLFCFFCLCITLFVKCIEKEAKRPYDINAESSVCFPNNIYTVNQNGDYAHFSYLGKDYSRLTEDKNYYFMGEKTVDPLAYYGGRPLYGFKNDEDLVFLYYQEDDIFSSENVFYLSSMVFPKVVSENIDRIELVDIEDAVFNFDGSMNTTKPFCTITNEEVIRSFIQDFDKNGSFKSITDYVDLLELNKEYWVIAFFKNPSGLCYVKGTIKKTGDGTMCSVEE